MRQIEIYRTQFKISDFIIWGRENLLDLSPNFQRRSVWSQGAKSFLIDTIVRGYPVPIIFLREKKVDVKTLRNTREVIDGQQRIRTIFSYIDPKLLYDFNPAKDSFFVEEQHNEEIAGIDFHNLPENLAQRILDYQFSVHSLPADTDDREVIQIFRRMNSTGYRLNKQELRNSQYFGKFRILMYLLAEEQLSRWRSWKVFNENDIARMQEVETTSEFAQLMFNGIVAKNPNSIDSLYENKNKEFPELDEIAKRFRNVMDSIGDNLGSKISSLPFKRKTLFYSLFAFFYDKKYGLNSKLEAMTSRKVAKSEIENLLIKAEKIKNKDVPEQVEDALARRTTHSSSRKAIFEFLKK